MNELISNTLADKTLIYKFPNGGEWNLKLNDANQNKMVIHGVAFQCILQHRF